MRNGFIDYENNYKEMKSKDLNYGSDGHYCKMSLSLSLIKWVLVSSVTRPTEELLQVALEEEAERATRQTLSRSFMVLNVQANENIIVSDCS